MLPTLCRRKLDMAALLGYAVSLISYFQKCSTYQKTILGETEPYVRHKTIGDEDLSGKDLVIIGDVHGCYDEMVELMGKVKKETEKPVITVFVGDMINKGPKSEEMLSYLLSASNTYCVRGNHEQKVLKEYFSYKNKNEEVPECRQWVKDLSSTNINFLRNLPYSLSIPSLKILVVHAGLVPGIHISLQDTNNLLNMRNLYWKPDDFHGEVLQATYRTDIGSLWADQWQGPEHIYFGHDAVRKLQQHEYTTGLDTGCVYGGKLSAMFFKLDESKRGYSHKKLISVTPFKAYKPVTH